MFTKEINPQTVSVFFFLPVNKQRVQHKPAQKTHLKKSQLVQNGRLSEAMKDCTISRQMSNPCCAWCQSVYLHQVQAFLSPVSTNGDAATGLNLAPFSASKQVHTLIWPLLNQSLSSPHRKNFSNYTNTRIMTTTVCRNPCRSYWSRGNIANSVNKHDSASLPKSVLTNLMIHESIFENIINLVYV